MRKMLTWVLLTKLFFILQLALQFDDRVPQLIVCTMFTTLSTYLLGRVIKRTIDEVEELDPETGAFDLYIKLCLDLGYTWETITGQSAVE